MSEQPFHLAGTPVHLGLGARVEVLAGFEWSEDYLAGYERDHASDGDAGRLVFTGRTERSWDSWECHPAGDELVVQLTGRTTLIREIDGERNSVELGPGQAVINPRGVWHTADVHEPGDALYVTPGRGTLHRPR